MDNTTLRSLLEELQRGACTLEGALDTLKDLPFAELGYATVDHHRALRQGMPEVIFGEAKSVEQIVGIARELIQKGQNVLATRVDATKAQAILLALPEAHYLEQARVLTVEQRPIPLLMCKPVALVCAGTGDLPVAEECAETLRLFGIRTERINDVGVAGVHRLLAKRARIAQCTLAIVIAGMEGALPSLVGGLFDMPVIAVPTSVGYGASFQGLAALLGMLTSCASGVTVCNIDNGFGAAFAAARILRMQSRLQNKIPES